MSLIPTSLPTIEEIRAKRGNHRTKRESIVLAVADSPHQPLTARQAAARVDRDGGATPHQVASALSAHPEVDAIENGHGPVKYRARNGGDPADG